ncbi:ABC transporter [Occultella glacieicola]|uniref:ABC transporter n=1 Tax=Occultella glacieicola TaxID=2518684 RepID=A0ABY2E934_9MICO|nr:ABC transporter [Occultella glacieicola]TDE95790.1 ABC transporter [Occultella glacieicola]
MSTPTAPGPRSPLTPVSDRGRWRRLGCAIAFEWTKLAGVRSTLWLLATGTLLTVAGALLIGASARASGVNGYDTATPAPWIAAQNISFTQVAILLVAVFAVTSEYASGSIRTTLLSVPSRGSVLLAKAAVLAGGSAVTGAALVLLGTVSAAAVAAEYGTYTGAQLGHAVLGTAISLALTSILALGIGTTLRNTAGTILTLVVILFALSSVLPIFGQAWLTDLVAYLPGSAAGALVTNASEPYGPAAALAVLAGWAVAGLSAGYLALRSRDT